MCYGLSFLDRLDVNRQLIVGGSLMERTNEYLEMQEVNVYTDDCGDIKVHCMNDCPINWAWLSEEN